jgi:hypothetical protein
MHYDSAHVESHQRIPWTVSSDEVETKWSMEFWQKGHADHFRVRHNVNLVALKKDGPHSTVTIFIIESPITCRGARYDRWAQSNCVSISTMPRPPTRGPPGVTELAPCLPTGRLGGFCFENPLPLTQGVVHILNCLLGNQKAQSSGTGCGESNLRATVMVRITLPKQQ